MRDSELCHYGVKGMKWGIRRYQNKDGTLTDAGKRRQTKKESKEQKRTQKNETKKQTSSKKKKSASEMTDSELQDTIRRMELEKRYRDLVRDAQPKKTKGQQFVENVLTRSGENIATQFTTYAMGRAVNKAFENVFNDPKIVNPKKGQKD